MTMIKSILPLLLLLLLACATDSSGAKNHTEMNTLSDSLEHQLVEIGYQKLFLFGQRNLAARMWQDGKNQAQLEAMIENPESSMHAKFLAAELLRHFEIDPNPSSDETLAAVYAHALAHSVLEREDHFQLFGNLWGLLYEEDDSGTLGSQLIQFGEHAVPYLIPLLSDEGPIHYEGSEDATIGNAYQYRVKDFAAFYLSKIKEVPVTFYQNMEERDQEIERLEALLEE